VYNNKNINSNIFEVHKLATSALSFTRCNVYVLYSQYYDIIQILYGSEHDIQICHHKVEMSTQGQSPSAKPECWHFR